MAAYFLQARLVNSVPLVLFFIVSMAGPSLAQEEEVIRGGELEFQRYCASCHGEDARGKGPLAEYLRIKPANLRLLSKANGGTFPFWRIYRTIDGREEVRAHGTRDMPVWGRRFQMEREGFGPLEEALVKGRILGIVFYLRSMQEW